MVILSLLLLPTVVAAAQPPEEVIPVEQQLAAAIDSGSVVAVRRVLEAGGDPNLPYEGTPPLVRAVRQGKSYVVDLLCRQGALVTTRDSEGWTPLVWAAERGEERVMRVLLKHGANPNATEPRHELSVLQMVCGNGNEAMARLLLQHGARWQHTDRLGGNCLEEAAFAGHAPLVELLRQQGMAVEWPLHLAAGLGQRERVAELIAMGADVNQPTGGWENSPLAYAVGGGQLEVAQMLVEHGARIDTRNAVGATLLHVAAAYGHVEMVVWLLEGQQDLRTAVDHEGYTPIDWSQSERVRQLLEPQAVSTGPTDAASQVSPSQGLPGVARPG